MAVSLSKSHLRIGLVGSGNIGRTHLTAISSISETNLLNVEVTALCDIDEKALSKSAGQFSVPNTFSDYSKLIASDAVDLVYICTPTNKHADIVKQTAKAGKALMCEKPLAHSCPQARELLAVTQDAGVHSGVDLVLRYDQHLLHARKLLEEHDFGKPMLAHIRDDQHFPIDYIYYSKWRGDKSVAGGGTLIEHSIHDIDLFQWFFGPIESVYAKVGFFSEREVEDQASLVMTHKDGTVSTLDSVWHWVERPNERAIEFFFEKGYIGLKLESGNRDLEYHLKGKGPVKVTQDAANDTLLEHLGLVRDNISPEAYKALTSEGGERYTAFNYALLKSITNNQAPSPNFLDAVSAHRIVDAAYESANRNQCVDPL